MRHRVAHRKLGRVTEHRLSMLRNLATALLQHEHIETTVPRAKELRPFAEQLITAAKRGVAAGGASAIHARRLVAADVADRDVLKKLFDTLAPRFAERPGGYVRIIKAGFRRGDSADMARVELIGSEFDPKKAKAEKEAKTGEAAAGEGLGGRIRRAAERVRGRKTDETEGGAPVHEHTKSVSHPSGKARHAGRSGKGS
jgi:large subunit ribosomal protein L17